MSASSVNSSSSQIQKTIPTPIISLGSNYVLQHTRADSIVTFMANNHSRSNKDPFGPLTQDGNTWANDDILVSLSFSNGDNSYFLSNTPMIFMEVLKDTGSLTHGRPRNNTQWIHPPNDLGSLNRTNTNYGGGTPSNLNTEWDLLTLTPFSEQVVVIEQRKFYRNPTITLPQDKTTFVSTSANLLKFRRSLMALSNSIYVVNNFIQPIRFRYAIIDPNNINGVILGEPSEVLLVYPKSGYFAVEDDSYFYDWSVKFSN